MTVNMNGLCSLSGILTDLQAFANLAEYLANKGYMVTIMVNGVEVRIATNAPEGVVRAYVLAHSGVLEHNEGEKVS